MGYKVFVNFAISSLLLFPAWLPVVISSKPLKTKRAKVFVFKGSKEAGTWETVLGVRGKQLQEMEWVEGAGNRGEESRLSSGLCERGKGGGVGERGRILAAVKVAVGIALSFFPVLSSMVPVCFQARKMR